MTTDQLRALLQTDPAAVLEADRHIYFEQIQKAAAVIAAHREQRPVVLLAGPSGSGKTTTALLLERALNRSGLKTHTLQMDDWFIPLTPDEIRLMERNELDLETPGRVDMPYFQKQLDQILNCERVKLPRYNFKASKREFDGRSLQRRPGEIVIIEGIHALNPEVTGHAENTTRIYVSVRTRIMARDGSVLHPSKIRLARRMLRDRTGRGRALTATIGMREKVDAGEQKHIMPYKRLAHCSIDSFYASEMGVYRPLLMEDLRPMLPAYPDLEDLVQIMEELTAVSTELVPQDSLLREFIGGSELPY